MVGDWDLKVDKLNFTYHGHRNIIQQRSSTHSFPQLSAKHLMIQAFVTYLTSLDGRTKSDRKAHQIVTNVSRYLMCAMPSHDNPNWLDLLDARKVRR